MQIQLSQYPPTLPSKSNAEIKGTDNYCFTIVSSRSFFFFFLNKTKRGEVFQTEMTWLRSPDRGVVRDKTHETHKKITERDPYLKLATWREGKGE